MRSNPASGDGRPGRWRTRGAELRAELAAVRAIPNLWRYQMGQLVSELGSEATLFVLMTYVYLETGSLVQFALLFAIDNVPDILFTPVAGVMVDRYDRRVLHIIGDGGVALVTTAALVLWSADGLSVATVYALVLVGSTFEVLQGSASEAMYQEMVPPRQLVRTGAVLGPLDEVVEIVAPAVGIGLLALAGAGFVFALDLVTFAVAIYTLFTLSNPEVFRSHLTPTPTVRGADTATASEVDEVEEADDDGGSVRFFLDGARFVRRSPGMWFIFVYSVFDDFLISLVTLMVAASALELGGEDRLAVVQAMAGAGAIVGMVGIALFGIRRGRVITKNVRGPGLVIGAALVIGATVAAVVGTAAGSGSLGAAAALALAAFVVMAMSAPLDAALEATSLAAIPKPLIGRVNAVFDLAGGIGNLLLLLGVAPLIDYVLEPAVTDGRIGLGPLIPVSPATGPLVALLLVIACAGAAYLALNVVAGLTRGMAAADELARAVEPGSPQRDRDEEMTT